MNEEQMAADAARLQSESDTTSLEGLGIVLLELDKDIDGLEAALKEAKAKRDALMRHELPQAMQEAQVTEFGFEYEGGRPRISLGWQVYGSLRRAPDYERAIAWLEEGENMGSVLTTVGVKFTEAEREEAQRIVRVLTESTGKGVDVKRDINASTLRSIARSAIEADPEFDPSIIGCEKHMEAKFTRRK